jgi:hypothetical protein
MSVDSLFAGGVFLTAQATVVIRIASGEVCSEPLVALDVVRGKGAFLFGIQGVEVWARRRGLPDAASICIASLPHQIVSGGLILALSRRG